MALSKIDPAGLDIGQIGGRRNLITNGAMQVAQRGTSFTGLTAGATYTLDRWLIDGSHDATLTIEQSSDAPEGFGSSLKLTATTADSSASSGQWCGLTQRLEGQDVQNLNFATSNAKQITASFWVKASTTGTGVVAFYQDDGNLYYGQQYSINSSNTWEYKTVTVSLPTSGTVIANDNTSGLRMYFGLLVGSTYSSGTTETWGNNSNWFVGQDNFIGTTNATFQITGVQLEVGTVATPFEHRSYGEELALCQRYYYVHAEGDNKMLTNASSYNTTQVHGIVTFPVTPRTTPTLVQTTGTNYYQYYRNNGSVLFDEFSTSGEGFQAVRFSADGISGETTGNVGFIWTASTDAKIAFNMEL